jgi:hypothetical protein
MTLVARLAVPIDALAVRRARASASIALVTLVTACGHGRRAPSAVDDAGALPAFSRSAFTKELVDGGTVLPVPTTSEPAALDEILGAAAKNAPSPDDERSLIGTDTHLVSDAGVHPPRADAPKSGRVRVGSVSVEPGMSSPAIERAARAQLYWPLVQRCRDPAGGILPPEVVRLTFHVDRDGYIVPATILAVAKETRFADAARCMARELGIVQFRAPAGGRGLPQVVTTDVPSVD